MTDAATDFGVPVEPVWYEASAVEDAAPEPAPAVEMSPEVETATPTPDDILPLVEPAPLVEAPVAKAPPVAPAEGQPRRQWRTLPVVAAVIAAALIGFVIGRVTDSSGGSSTKAGGSPDQSSAGTPPAQTPPNPGGTTQTSAAPGQINDNAVLLNIPRHTGPLITDHFTVTANRWVLGWAYDCTAQGGTGSFNITVFDGSGGPSKDGGIDQQGGKGSSVVAYTSTGERYLSVTTNCVWAIRVTT